MTAAAMTDDDFRAEVRDFLRHHLPADMAARNRTAVHPTREDTLGWQAILARRGWSVPSWPAEHGGPGWTPLQRYIFEEEQALAGAPANNIQGVSLVGPVIYTFGNAAQRARHLPGIIEGKVFWSQGFSEPNAGSDLASLRTRAVRDGDHYIVTGQKIWTSQSMMADWIFCLVRTNPSAKPQRGISFLLVPADAPGITIRPIRSIDEGESLCEVFFDAVRVAAENLIGEEGRGWDYAKFLLGLERATTAEVPRNKRYLATLKEILGSADDAWRRRVARIEVDLRTLEAGALRAIGADQDDMLLPSALKLHGCDLMQTTLKAQVEALGPHGLAYWPQGHDDAPVPPVAAHGRDVAAEFLFRRAATIYGGSSEVQKNIIAKVFVDGDMPAKGLATDEQRMMQDSVARFVARDYAFDARRRMPAGGTRAMWRQFAELGWLGAGLPEETGGFGGGIADAAVIAEGLGRALVLEPYVGCAVMPGRALAAAGGQQALLAVLASGETIFAFAHDGDVRADRDLVLTGRKVVVMGGAMADRFLVSAYTAEGPTLFLVDRGTPGLAVLPYRTLDARMVADIELAGVQPAAVIGRVGDAGPAIEAAVADGLLALCAESYGAMDQAMRITRDYLRLRQQFGAPLSTFQALRHRLAEMYVAVDLSGAFLRQALASGDVALAPSVKIRFGQAGFFVGAQAVQLHGGIGMTEECQAGHFFKRLCVNDLLLGTAEQHVGRMAS
ncbi:MAG: acyl-CoA dehydrogenase family protein [Alphaproteobacteria bacterium]|jgi:acyl-CoA dehydrogenase|nr:acyl-CoA dehydrogenase family protein [Alphaproteobacteria bacterium]